MKDFNKFKSEILSRANNFNVCDSLYKKELESTTFAELMQVIKDNFQLFCIENFIDEKIIEEYKDIFNQHDIYCNESRESGYLLVTGHVDKICGDCKAFIMGDAVVNNVCGNAEIKYVLDNATIEKVFGDALIFSVYGNAVIDEVSGNARIYSVCGNAKIKKVCATANIYYVFNNAIIDEVGGDARINEITGNAVIDEVSDRALVLSVCGNAIVGRKLWGD